MNKLASFAVTLLCGLVTAPFFIVSLVAGLLMVALKLAVRFAVVIVCVVFCVWLLTGCQVNVINVVHSDIGLSSQTAHISE